MSTRDTLLNQIKHGTTKKIKYGEMELQIKTPKHADIIEYTSEDEDIRTAAGFRMIIDCVKDEEGKPVFTEKDVVFLKDDRSPLVDFLFNEIIKLRVKMINEIEAQEKN